MGVKYKRSPKIEPTLDFIEFDIYQRYSHVLCQKMFVFNINK